MSRSISITRIISEIDHQSYRQRHPEYVAELAATRRVIEEREKGYNTSTLPTFSQAALLTMHESQVKRALIARLLAAWNGAMPRRNDFRILVERGLAEYKHGKRLHDLTPQGIIAVKKLEQQLCARFNIHELIEGPRRGWEQTYRCTCGKSYAVRASTTSFANVRAQWAREHATEAGITKLYDAMAPVAKAGA